MRELRQETVLGLDNIPLDLPVARLGSRGLAALLDYLVVWLVIAAWVVAGGILGSLVGLDRGWTFALLAVGGFAVDWGYFTVSEIVTRGSTLGKRALKLRVVSRSGGRPGTSALLARNLVRVVDLLVGGLLMAFDPLSRRVGDWLGGTLVVHVEAQPRAQEVVLNRVPAGWGPKRVAVAEALLARADELEPTIALILSRRMVNWIERDDPELLAGLPVEEDPQAALGRALMAGR